MKKIIISCLLFAVFSLPAVAIAAAIPRVVVSIKPIHSLVAGVMQGVGQPQLLVKGGGSPHGYILRPSEARSLAAADLVVWIDPALESFLEKPLRTLGDNAMQLRLAERLRGHLLAKKTKDHNDLPHAHHSHHDHGSAVDLHLWLDPRMAQRIVSLTGTALAEIDPSNSGRYKANSEQMIKRLQQLHQQLKVTLEPVSEVPYVVFHAAYHYFETAYGLNSVGAITIDPSRKPGVKRLKAIRTKISNLQARCVFSEPQFESKLVATVIAGTGAKKGVLDPLGSDLPPGPEAYFQLMTRLGDNLAAGLK